MLTGIRPMSDLTSAGRRMITAAFDQGAVTTLAIFAVLAEVKMCKVISVGTSVSGAADVR